MSRVLVIRLSALGDVAMLIPVLYSVAVKYPEDEFVLVTKSPLLEIFERKPVNVSVFPVFTKEQHRGWKGLWRLIKELKTVQPDQVADMHNIIRAYIIRSFFRVNGKKTAAIDKGKAEKKALTRKHNKQLTPLQTSIERYHHVFTRLGYDFQVDFQTLFDFGERDFSLIEPFTGPRSGTWVGIAPFAKHQGKIYPPEKMEAVIRSLNSRPHTQIFLFGGKEDTTILEEWASRYPSAICVAGRLSFSTELLLMSYLDVMLTMDSGNMHLASLVGTPVLSVWGATHPYTGFYGYRQQPGNAIQTDLFCRPCSVFGDKPCYRHNYECLHSISPESILQKLIHEINH